MPARLGTSVEARGNIAVKWILLLTLLLFAPALAFGNGGECTVHPPDSAAAFGHADCADSTNDDKPVSFDAHLEKGEACPSGKTQAGTLAFVYGGECTVYPPDRTQTSTAAFGRADCADSTNGD